MATRSIRLAMAFLSCTRKVNNKEVFGEVRNKAEHTRVNSLKDLAYVPRIYVQSTNEMEAVRDIIKGNFWSGNTVVVQQDSPDLSTIEKMAHDLGLKLWRVPAWIEDEPPNKIRERTPDGYIPKEFKHLVDPKYPFLQDFIERDEEKGPEDGAGDEEEGPGDGDEEEGPGDGDRDWAGSSSR